MQNLLYQLSFEGVKPGIYKPREARMSLLDMDPTPEPSTLGGKETYSSRCLTAKELKYDEKEEKLDHVKKSAQEPEKKKKYSLFTPSRDDNKRDSRTHDYELVSAGIDDSLELLGDVEPLQISAQSGVDEVLVLENLLALEYKNPNLKITKIDEALKSRKEVRRVFFVNNDELSQVWIYKADPKETAKELSMCKFVYEKGIPTARPIGYDPQPGEDYPFDIAILGGVVEHAGDPYDTLLNNLQLSPELMFSTTKGVAKLLADFHYKLTISMEELVQSGIQLDRASPRREIYERMVPTLNLQQVEVEKFVRSCEELYDHQEGERVVSHGDFHTGNLVTILKHGRGSFGGISLKKFGMIDYGSACIDYLDSDLEDFWTHHKRKAVQINPEYNFNINEVRGVYEERLDSLGKRGGRKINIGSCKNKPIQEVLWNVYEMFDPTRLDPIDKQKKFDYHYNLFLECKPHLEKVGLGREYDRISFELNHLLQRFVE